MKTNLQTLVVPVSIAASFLIGCSTSKDITGRADPTRDSATQVREGYDTFGRKWEVLSRNESALLTYTGTITDIDYAAREMTLKGPKGDFETFVVDKKVQRFSEAKVRPPTNEEKANPLVVVDAAGKASPDAAPAAYDMRHVRAVVTIEAMDKSAQTVTVKGPRGKYYTARVKDPSRLDKVRIGDSILMTFTEATVVSLEPAAN